MTQEPVLRELVTGELSGQHSYDLSLLYDAHWHCTQDLRSRARET